MNYLTHYVQAKQTALFIKTRAFFAFSNEQLHAREEEGVEYVSMGAGMVCPKSNAKELYEGLKLITVEGIKEDIAENGIDAIIERELSNHEAYYVGNIEDTVEALEDYGVTPEQVLSVYNGTRDNHE
ncbi:MAG: hypothetical protein GQ570_03665 [Helicobacteraceae bacterium]|nr:hypothetical protein [Helicobacteraceae bacterium]